MECFNCVKALLKALRSWTKLLKPCATQRKVLQPNEIRNSSVVNEARIFLSSSFTPESLRWLLVKGKMEEAENLYRKIARINGKELPEEGLEIDTGIDENKSRLGDLRDLFKTKSLMKTTLISCFCW